MQNAVYTSRRPRALRVTSTAEREDGVRDFRNAARVGPRLGTLPVAVMIVAAAAMIGLLFVGYRMAFASKPVVALGTPFKMVGRNAPLVVEVKDPRHGIKALRITIEQGGKEQVLLDAKYAPPKPDVHFRWMASQDKAFRLAEGAARLKVQARNASWGNFFRGRSASIDQAFNVRLVPPRIEVLTTQHYVNQGGCDMVVYRVSESATESGVAVGSTFFRGFPMPGAADPRLRFAIFAFPYDAPPNTTLRLRARDDAANEVVASFNVKVTRKAFRSRPLPIDDAFLEKVVPEILSQSPTIQDQGDLLKNYLAINGELRKANNAQLAEMAGRSQERFLWTQPFQQLGNSQVEASFADHRTYMYKEREVDRQDHLGYDLASTSNVAVSASNDGVVMLAEFFGIYGNTVVIDHGYGLLSLYGHLSSFAVKAGDTVKRGQTVGKSGATGLAGGDHLHYSMILQSAQVDPKEWWDPHWIKDRITSKLSEEGR
jgi:murein DD-endopeptidase MepM/ murein hydrolase activator NlpD